MDTLKYIAREPLSHPVLLGYLYKKYGVAQELAKTHLQQVYYEEKSVSYLSFGIENESQGFEIELLSKNNPGRAALIKEDIVCIQGNGKNGWGAALFGHIIDYLQECQRQDVDRLDMDAFIMPDASLFVRTVRAISGDYAYIEPCLPEHSLGQALRTFCDTINPPAEASFRYRYVDFLSDEDIKDVARWYIKDYGRQPLSFTHV